jgi:hypothetical protein
VPKSSCGLVLPGSGQLHRGQVIFIGRIVALPDLAASPVAIISIGTVESRLSVCCFLQTNDLEMTGHLL